MTALEEFRQTYLRLCKDHHVEPQNCVLSQLGSAQKSGKRREYCLNLSTHSLSVQTAGILAKIFHTDRTFMELKFNDCMVPEEGIKALAHGCSENVVCKKLDLKGNNIRGTATEGLGRLLRQNTHLLSLCLEWNCMGMLDTSFSVFCEGLGSNSSLQVLDLRNNQINHDGATELGAAIKRNTTLRSLDLRWNNVGLIGGRALLNALDYNKTLMKLELAGNNTPPDLLKSIETAVSHNADHASLSAEHLKRHDMLSNEITDMKHSRHIEATDLLDKLDRQEATMKKTNRTAAQRISELQKALEERKAQYNTIVAKFSLSESELAMSESKVAELSTIVLKTKEHHGEMIRQHQNELKHDRAEKAIIESRLNKQLIAANEKTMELENQIDELERKCKSQQEQIFDLKEQLTSVHAENKLKTAQFDERLLFEKQKMKDAYQNNDELKLKEIHRVQQESVEMEKHLKDRIHKLELHRIEQEEDISRHKNNLALERIHAEEQLSSSKQHLKHEEEQRIRQLDEKMRMLTASKNELQSHSSQQATSIADHQARNSNLLLENEGLKHQIENLNQEVLGKNTEVQAEVNIVRLELGQKIQKLENERASQAELYNKINMFEKELGESTSKLKSTADEKDKEIFVLTAQLKTKEGEIRHMQESDSQRMAMLQSAMQSYINKPAYN